MLLHMLRAKIHRAIVTGSELHYEGSLAISPELLKASGMLEGERVQVVNVNNGSRLETYLIRGKAGEVCLNGPAARLGLPGDKIIIISYALLAPEEARTFKPVIVVVDEKNRVTSTS